ncbi:MAG: acyl-CoA thioesterase [Deltaproteobacteria bacterium]|nr:acyl-CoA thioesterase [Deltaproteobacteria bacterium]
MQKDSTPARELFTCRVPLEVRWRDVDAMGHVNNAVFLTYFEVGRVGYFREVFGKPGSLGSDFPFIIARASCDFLAPAKFGETIDIHVRISRIGGKSFEFEYLMTAQNDGRVVATGSTVQACYDYASGRTIEVPAGFKDAVFRYERTKPTNATG